MNNQIITTNQNYISEDEITIIPAEKNIVQKMNNIIENFKVQDFLLLRDDIEELELLTTKSNTFKGIRVVYISKGFQSSFRYICPNCNGIHTSYIQ